MTRPFRIALAVALLGVVSVATFHSLTAQLANAKRVPWTTSRIVGTPEPPHSYRAQRAFPKISFSEPVFMVQAPGSDRWFVVERRGKIVSFVDSPDAATVDLVCDLPAEVSSWDPAGPVKNIRECYALAFHPQFAKNRTCYVCYILEGKKERQLPEGTRISRFTVTDTNPPRLDPKSETVLLTFLGGGHNGCDLQFGNDGMLYISSGDGSNPNPPDARQTGQDVSDLLASILRIDVDRTDPGLQYAIPKDNPFVGRPNIRGEIFAYGFRNPWRMSFDRPTGDLWVGDVGWELWEMVDRVQKGGNYGWPIKEGRQDVLPNGKRGPTPLLPPTLVFPHTEAASITGGFVYRGKKFPELAGAYICGDFVTRRLWATKFDSDKILWHKEIAQTNARIVSFAESRDGELYFLDFTNPGGIFTLVPNDDAKTWRDTFPRRLSETGLFASAKDHALAPGVRAFGVNVPQWMDGAHAERFVAFPGLEKGKLFDRFFRTPDDWGSYAFPPKDGVFGKTISIPLAKGEPARRLETQILHFDGVQWRGYTYAWNDDQTDALLVDAKGRDQVLLRDDDRVLGGKRKQTWRFPSRAECLVCHNPWGGFTLGFTPAQLDDGKHTQLQGLIDEGWIDLLAKRDGKDLPTTPAQLPHDHRLPASPHATADEQARAYLHVNCAHCHQFGAGGTADIDLRSTAPLAKMKVVNVAPLQGAFDLPDAKIVAAGDPMRSALYYRMAKLGRGRMPHLGSDVVDQAGLEVVRQWIQNLSPRPETADALARLDVLEIPDAKLQPADVKARAAEQMKLIEKLLASPETALALTKAIDARPVEAPLSRAIIASALAHANPHIRDLFERYAAADARIERLGASIDPGRLLALNGNLDRGRELFFSSTFQCGNCHQVAKRGGQLGPDLADVAKRLSKTQIVESLLTPSKTIDAKYLTHAVETHAGQIHTGLLVEKTANETVLRVLGDKELRIPTKDIASTNTLPTSLMPDNLLRDATAVQAADLLAYLWSLK